MTQVYDQDVSNYDVEAECPACDGTGEENVCVDDMCSSMDECMHGDGMIVCRTCGGNGSV